jgi:hypothetical protein
MHAPRDPWQRTADRRGSCAYRSPADRRLRVKGCHNAQAGEFLCSVSLPITGRHGACQAGCPQDPAGCGHRFGHKTLRDGLDRADWTDRLDR